MVVECKLAKPRVVKCVGERFLVRGDQGELVVYNTVTNKCSLLYKDSSLASYSVLEVDNDREYQRACQYHQGGHVWLD